jgi:hypothetical protein
VDALALAVDDMAPVIGPPRHGHVDNGPVASTSAAAAVPSRAPARIQKESSCGLRPCPRTRCRRPTTATGRGSDDGRSSNLLLPSRCRRRALTNAGRTFLGEKNGDRSSEHSSTLNTAWPSHRLSCCLAAAPPSTRKPISRRRMASRARWSVRRRTWHRTGEGRPQPAPLRLHLAPPLSTHLLRRERPFRPTPPRAGPPLLQSAAEHHDPNEGSKWKNVDKYFHTAPESDRDY